MSRSGGESTRSNIRAILSTRSRLFRDCIRVLIEQSRDIDVVAETLDPVDLLIATGRDRPDVIVIDLDEAHELPGITSHVQSEFESVSFVGISPRGDTLRVCFPGNVTEEVPVTSSTSILEAIRRACGSP